jgi:uncharacterized protein (DUF433 family)
MNFPDWERLTVDPLVMGGKPCIRGTRVTVGTLVGLVASGASVAEILVLYPYITEPDIRVASQSPKASSWPVSMPATS